MAMSVHAQQLGLNVHNKILAAGGSSTNKGMMQVLSNVFGVPVYTGEQPKAAALGGSYKALHGWRCHTQKRFVPFAEVVGQTEFTKAADPDVSLHQNIYKPLMERYKKLEGIVIKNQYTAKI